MATEADLIQKFKDLDIPVGADFEELIHVAFAGSNLADQLNSKADDSKVVHTADMRKPANDVAGIEETVLDNHDNTITANGTSYDLSKSGLTSLQNVSSGSFNDLPLGTVMADATLTTDGPDKSHDFTTTTFYSTVYGGRKAQIAIADNTNLMFFRTCVEVSKWARWTLLSDDSKVAHLSGANNFDTVPTVNNNPLLLASSLPSTLADTTKSSNFTAGLQKGGADVATQSDVTTAISTATANMVDSTKVTNFTAGLQSGGVDVATAADLKSIEDSAWHEVSLPDSTILKNAHFMYRSELIDAHYNIPFILTGTVIVPTVKSSDGVILLDLSSYLPIPKDDYKNYTVNSAILGPSDKSFIESDNDVFSPNYYLGERYLRIKFVNSDLVLYSTGGYAYFRGNATILLVMSSDLESLPTIHFVPSTKS